MRTEGQTWQSWKSLFSILRTRLKRVLNGKERQFVSAAKCMCTRLQFWWLFDSNLKRKDAGKIWNRQFFWASKFSTFTAVKYTCITAVLQDVRSNMSQVMSDVERDTNYLFANRQTFHLAYSFTLMCTLSVWAISYLIKQPQLLKSNGPHS